MMLDENTRRLYRMLLDRAEDASQNAYAPYSNFRVGADVLDSIKAKTS